MIEESGLLALPYTSIWRNIVMLGIMSRSLS